jgi:hypothetical protein
VEFSGGARGTIHCFDLKYPQEERTEKHGVERHKSKEYKGLNGHGISLRGPRGRLEKANLQGRRTFQVDSSAKVRHSNCKDVRYEKRGVGQGPAALGADVIYCGPHHEPTPRCRIGQERPEACPLKISQNLSHQKS